MGCAGATCRAGPASAGAQVARPNADNSTTVSTAILLRWRVWRRCSGAAWEWGFPGADRRTGSVDQVTSFSCRPFFFR